MKYLQKNIWLAFYLILTLGLVSVTIILYLAYKNIYHDVQIEQENIVKISSNSVESLLHQHEVVLDILGNELLREDNYKNPKKAAKIIDNLIGIEKSKTAYGVTKPNGELYVIESKNMHKIKQFPNMFDNEVTKDSFQQTLESNKLVVGRTYYSDNIDLLFVPLRKAIRDQNKKVLFVVSVVLIINEEGYAKLIHDSDHSSNYNIFIYRHVDRYYQIAPKKQYKNKEIYNYQFPLKEVQREIQKMEKKYGLSLKQIQEQGVITHNETKREPLALLSSYYLKKFGLWVVVNTDLSIIKSTFYKISSGVLLFFIIINLLIYWLFRIIDKSDTKKKLALTYQANHDYLTQLHNRLYLDTHLRKLDEQNPFYLLFIDMDNFKAINDSYGHEYGDRVLIEISRRLKKLQNQNDIVIRYSGDEFLFLGFDLNEKAMNNLAKTLLKELAKPYVISNSVFHLSASIGIAHYPTDGSSIDEIKRYADLALYEAKNKKNFYTVFKSEMKSNYLNHVNIENKMKSAFMNNEFYMVYQPQVCNNGDVCGVEALVRWHNEELGFIGPDKFIPIAESSNQMERLGRYVLTTSLTEFKKLEDQLDIDITLSINISVKQFMEEDFSEYLMYNLEKLNFNKKMLQLEITESIFIEDVDYIIETLNTLRQEGIKVSLDDFGTGYSSLSLLKRLPIDELKIDKSFVDDILHKEASLTMVESIIAIAKQMKMTIVAEGIEELAQKQELQRMGCNLYQGYYYAKPLKIEELNTFITKKNLD